MSEITDWIQSYRNGDLTFSELRRGLVNRTYRTPQRFIGPPDDVFERELWLETVPDSEEGTWDEVDDARDAGLITEQEYQQIADAVWNAHHGEGG